MNHHHHHEPRIGPGLQETYEQLGYVSRDEPIIAFGFLSILLQGILLSVIYPLLCRGKSVPAGAATLVLVMGGYLAERVQLSDNLRNPRFLSGYQL